MEATRSSGAGSGNSGAYTTEIAESLRFEEEIQSLMSDTSPPTTASSFTALLGLPASQAVELLHEPDPAAVPGADTWWLRLRDQASVLPQLPLGFAPTFPSNATLVERAARFSVFAVEESPEASNSGERSPVSQPNPANSGGAAVDRPSKRKPSASKAKGTAKRSRSGEEAVRRSAEENSAGGDKDKEKLSYVHVRARRGQATDSHSLAERARREKINARMKLLQELVPGCNKISGTALVLDEIINHVQSLQRQVEILSMRLAAVNPRIEFGGIDSFLSSSAECGGRVMAGEGRGGVWSEASSSVNGGRAPPPHHHHHHHHQHQPQQPEMIWHVDLLQGQVQQQRQQWGEEEEKVVEEKEETHHRHRYQAHVFIGPPGTTGSSSPSFFPYDSANPVPLQPNQLKTEL